MNRQLRHISIFCGILFLALLLRDNWLQYVKADQLDSSSLNRRVAIERYSHKRGDIIVDGKPITGSVKTDDLDLKYKTTWTDGAEWAPVTGYASQAFGSTGLENVDDDILTGSDDRLFRDRTLSMFTGEQQEGGSIVTTLNAAAQKAAFEGLGKKKGAVAAIDPTTGKILALASTPSYDPSSFAGMSNADGKAYNALKHGKDRPMLNRALKETYPPGSTFKLVTASAALESGKVTDVDAPTNSPLPYIMPGTTTPLNNEGNLPCENATLRVALEVSCNSVFGKLGADMGVKSMASEAEKFGFNNYVDTPVRAVASVFPTGINTSQTALSSIGQFDTAATPLQMAMVGAAIANDGKLMHPYMVDELRAPNLDVIDKTQPKEMSQPLTPEHAQELQSMMESVVQKGTGAMAQISGVTVGGKTGTAQHGENNSGLPYAWFVSYAKVSNSSPVAVAVVVEDGSANRNDISGGGLAAPIAKAVMQAVINSNK
ncbi:peptidoglycan D,D-transpeptidase FtsI family protein [Streptomyces sp. NPDC008222]|uniref:peptidoglycan D,D-transpeptidase FtsI family protein n=1 Tax=Streptomyces sp. NPDC008222 TaxID=3364820 RepID=UPI0036E55140